MKKTEAQKRASAKWFSKPEIKERCKQMTYRRRDNNREEYNQTQKVYNKLSYIKKLGYFNLEDYELDCTIKCIRYMYEPI
tara:strand:- start:556 stop:795 length:240 start_codon:yes stop_codon:yes gene_type:complete